jgi:transposase
VPDNIRDVRGRPTKLTPEVEDDLVLLLASGVPIPVAARAVNVSERSVERWLQGDLRQRVAEVRARGQSMSDAASEARLVVLISLAAKDNWRAAAWLLSRRWPQRWSAERRVS